jgi:hypothetical protein
MAKKAGKHYSGRMISMLQKLVITPKGRQLGDMIFFSN